MHATAQCFSYQTIISANYCLGVCTGSLWVNITKYLKLGNFFKIKKKSISDSSGGWEGPGKKPQWCLVRFFSGNHSRMIKQAWESRMQPMRPHAYCLVASRLPTKGLHLQILTRDFLYFFRELKFYCTNF